MAQDVEARRTRRGFMLLLGTSAAAATAAPASDAADAYIPMTEKGAASGVAQLDAEKKIPLAQLPDAALAPRLITTIEPPANGEAVAQVTSRLVVALRAGGSFYIKAGVYTVNNTLPLGPNTTVECHPDVVIKLADGVLPTAPTATFDVIGVQQKTGNGRIAWFGGTIDGNDSNQGFEDFADGAQFDRSKGFFIRGADYFEIGGVTIRETRGHAVGFWGCDTVFGHDLRFDQRIVPDPTGAYRGGRRRDGITGMARVINIQNVGGFTNDDMVGVVAGASWFSDTAGMDVDSVTIRDVQCGSKDGHDTYHGVSIYAQNGATVRDISVSNVTGRAAGALVRVGSYKSLSEPDSVSTGYFDRVDISHARGTLSNETFGGETGHAFISLPYTNIKSLSVSNCSWGMDGTGFDRPMVRMWHGTVESLVMTNVTFRSDTSVARTNPIVSDFGTGEGFKTIFLTNVSSRVVGAGSDTPQAIYQKATYDHACRTKIALAAVENTVGAPTASQSLVSVTGNGQVTPFGFGLVMNYVDVGKTIAAMPTAHFYDPSVGSVICNPDGTWSQVSSLTRPWTINQGRPTAGRFDVGFLVNVTGSPNDAVIGYRVTKAGTVGWNSAPIFQPILSHIPRTHTTITGASGLADWLAGTYSTFETTSGNSATFPSGKPGTLVTFRGTMDISSFQEYHPRLVATFYKRMWQPGTGDVNTGTWGPWFAFTPSEVK